MILPERKFLTNKLNEKQINNPQPLDRFTAFVLVPNTHPESKPFLAAANPRFLI
jgi:hypothetical protein